MSRPRGEGLNHFLNRHVSAPVNESMAVAHAPTNRRPTRKKGKKKGMCSMPGCMRQSVYGPLPPAPPPERGPPSSHLGMARPTFCGRHKNSSHVDLRNPRCVFPNCLSRSVYGPPPRLSSRLPSSTLALSSGKYFNTSILHFLYLSTRHFRDARLSSRLPTSTLALSSDNLHFSSALVQVSSERRCR